MDGLSNAASIIAVIQLAGSVYKLCQGYILSVKDARRDIELLCREIVALHDVLKAIDGHSQRTDTSKPSILRQIQKSCGEPLKMCHDELKSIQDTLETYLPTADANSLKPMSRVGMRALKWPFTQKDLKVKIDTLGKGKDTLNLALTAETTYVM